MTGVVGAKGQVVIPKEFREALGIRPGDRVDFTWIEGHLTVQVAQPKTPLYGRLADSPGMAEELLAERKKDREREEART